MCVKERIEGQQLDIVCTSELLGDEYVIRFLEVYKHLLPTRTVFGIDWAPVDSPCWCTTIEDVRRAVWEKLIYEHHLFSPSRKKRDWPQTHLDAIKHLQLPSILPPYRTERTEHRLRYGSIFIVDISIRWKVGDCLPVISSISANLLFCGSATYCSFRMHQFS